METVNIFKDVKVFKETGYGISVVDHDLRCELDLTVSQYCAIDVIAQRKTKKKTTSVLDITTFLGVDGNIIESMLTKLEKRKLIINKDGNYYLNKKLANKINKKNDYSEQFMDFWTIEVDNKVINAWPGPKPRALQLYEKARKNKRSHKFIMDQRYWYFKLLEVQIYRQKMIATRFLNIDSGELDQDFKGEYEKVVKKNDKGKDIGKVSAVTMDDFKKEFEHDKK